LAARRWTGCARGRGGVIKHMPGHGRAGGQPQGNAHGRCRPRNWSIDLAPFRTLAGARSAMTGHVRYTAWDAENPATQSPFMIGEVIRKRIGFDGLLMTDDLDMEALAGSVPERAARAIAAGCDLVLNCWAKMDDMVGIASATPTSARRAERLARALRDTPMPPCAGAPGGLVARATLLALAEADA
jgi:beta-N-acetylhexosaminidase